MAIIVSRLSLEVAEGESTQREYSLGLRRGFGRTLLYGVVQMAAVKPAPDGRVLGCHSSCCLAIADVLHSMDRIISLPDGDGVQL